MQNCTKVLGNVSFVTGAYFCFRPKKNEKKKVLAFLATFQQLFEKFLATFWETSSNLWQALVAVECGALIH